MTGQAWPPPGVDWYYHDDYTCIACADCRDVLPLLPKVEGVILMDPPYGMRYSSGWNARPIAGDESTDVRDEVLAMWDGPAVVFGRWDCTRPKNVRARLVWSKGEWPGMGDLSFPWGPSDEEIYIIGDGFTGRRIGTVLSFNRMSGNTLHPNEKPIPLLESLIERCPPAMIVDPFMGSGSTLRAAKDLRRRAIGIEISEDYCRIAAKRMAQEVLAL